MPVQKRVKRGLQKLNAPRDAAALSFFTQSKLALVASPSQSAANSRSVAAFLGYNEESGGYDSRLETCLGNLERALADQCEALTIHKRPAAAATEQVFFNLLSKGQTEDKRADNEQPQTAKEKAVYLRDLPGWADQRSVKRSVAFWLREVGIAIVAFPHGVYMQNCRNSASCRILIPADEQDATATAGALGDTAAASATHRFYIYACRVLPSEETLFQLESGRLILADIRTGQLLTVRNLYEQFGFAVGAAANACVRSSAGRVAEQHSVDQASWHQEPNKRLRLEESSWRTSLFLTSLPSLSQYAEYAKSQRKHLSVRHKLSDKALAIVDLRFSSPPVGTSAAKCALEESLRMRGLWTKLQTKGLTSSTLKVPKETAVVLWHDNTATHLLTPIAGTNVPGANCEGAFDIITPADDGCKQFECRTLHKVHASCPGVAPQWEMLSQDTWVPFTSMSPTANLGSLLAKSDGPMIHAVAGAFHMLHPVNGPFTCRPDGKRKKRRIFVTSDQNGDDEGCLPSDSDVAFSDASGSCSSTGRRFDCD